MEIVAIVLTSFIGAVLFMGAWQLSRIADELGRHTEYLDGVSVDAWKRHKEIMLRYNVQELRQLEILSGDRPSASATMPDAE